MLWVLFFEGLEGPIQIVGNVRLLFSGCLIFSFLLASLVRWPKPSSASRRRRCRFRWWSGHSRLHCRSRRSSARRRSWRPKSRSLQKQRNTDWRGWLRLSGEYWSVILLCKIKHIKIRWCASNTWTASRRTKLNIKIEQFAISLLPGSLQLIMEAEAEAESIRVSSWNTTSRSHFHFSLPAC